MGYEALHNAGHRRGELKGWKCGVFVGDSGQALRAPNSEPSPWSLSCQGSDWDGIHWTAPKNMDIKLAGRCPGLPKRERDGRAKPCEPGNDPRLQIAFRTSLV